MYNRVVCVFGAPINEVFIAGLIWSFVGLDSWARILCCEPWKLEEERGLRLELISWICYYIIIMPSTCLQNCFVEMQMLMKIYLCFDPRPFGPPLWWRNGWISSLRFMISVKMKLTRRVKMMVWWWIDEWTNDDAFFVRPPFLAMLFFCFITLYMTAVFGQLARVKMNLLCARIMLITRGDFNPYALTLLQQVTISLILSCPWRS